MADDIQKEIREILGRVITIETKIDNYNEMKNRVDIAYNQSCNNKTSIHASSIGSDFRIKGR